VVLVVAVAVMLVCGVAYKRRDMHNEMRNTGHSLVHNFLCRQKHACLLDLCTL